MNKAFKYRLYPTKEQEKTLFFTLNRCRELYNAALSERKDSYRYTGKGVTYFEQKHDLPEIKDIREEYKNIYSQVLQDVLARLDKGMKAFFRRIKNGENPGFPRFQGRNRYTSFTYTQMGTNKKGYPIGPSIRGKRVHLPKIGDVKLTMHRPMQGTPKTCTIKHEVDQWYVTFSCELAEEDVVPNLPVTSDAIGIDLGLLHFATLSTFPSMGTSQQRNVSDMKRYNTNHDKRPIAVSSAHWNDARAYSFDAPCFEAMHHLSTPATPTPAFSFQPVAPFLDCQHGGIATSGRDFSQISCNNIAHDETQL